MLKKRSVTLILSILLLPFAQAQAPRTYTSSEILLQLKKLNTVGSVLYIAAHPDDENTRLISYLANEKCLRTGYLSLTRGDGGQNLVGSEQGIELGIIRTQELLAARRVDGGEQFFTRAYDFGFSKTPEETFQKWNHDSILADVVWVIRNFRPDIIITRFAPDGSGGHGHHTASAILAEEAFDAAADPNRFPEQLKYVSVWKTRRMLYNTVARFRDPNADMSAYIPLDVGGYNALLGKSYGEISADSRSMHKSQGFGSARQRGEYLEHFKPVKGDTTRLNDIFQGMDFSWKREKYGEKLGKSIEVAIKNFNINKPENSTADLDNIAKEMEAYHLKKSLDGSMMSGDLFYTLNEIMANINGIYSEAVSKSYYVSVDDSIYADISVIKRSAVPATLKTLQFNYEAKDSNNGKELKQNKLILSKQAISVGSALQYQDQFNSIYWLQKPINNNRFDIPWNMVGAPEFPSYFKSSVDVQIGKETVSLVRPVKYKWTDPEKGELYRPLVITPPAMVNVTSEVLAFSDDKSREIKVIVRAGKDKLKGVLKVRTPQGWEATTTPANNDDPSTLTTFDASISIDKKGMEQTFSFFVTPDQKAADGILTLVVEVDGKEYTKGIKEIKYDHIPVQTLFPEAEVKLIRLDVKRKLKRIGYIPGAGDEMIPCLTQLGYEVTTITDDRLATENLSQYEAIITGVRAYNTNEKLPLYKQKLMDYVAAGGNLVVQYNTNSFAGPLNSDMGPYKFKLTRDRVTDENAKVTFLLPDHPVLNTPNKITDKDFEGWIQERCIYSAGELAPEYVSPLSMADPNEKANTGSLIIAKHGKGNFIYTGLVFFREMPAGVPGAYRLFVNLIELGK